jgi:hypothetical protein
MRYTLPNNRAYIRKIRIAGIPAGKSMVPAAERAAILLLGAVFSG